MKITENKKMKKSHPKYDEFDSSQFIIELDQNETIEILVNGKKEIEYIAKYINCHANIVFQDKGEMKEEFKIIPQKTKDQLEIERLKKLIEG